MGRTTSDGRCRQTIEYSPLRSQQRFHSSKARFKGFSGSIGSGKSQALCHEAIRLSYLNPGRTGLIGAPTYPMLRDATMAALLEILDRNRIPHNLNRSEFVLTFIDTGSRVLLRSLEEFERLRGTNLAWFGVDELTYTSEEAWLRLEGRLRDPGARRLCGFGVWTPKGYDWVYRRFLKDSNAQYEVIRAEPLENRHILEAVPDFYDRLKGSYDESFYRQEALGEYLDAKAGRVYDQFDRAEHVSDLAVDPRLPLYWALDFNVNPMSSVVAQSVGNEVRVLDEIVLSRAKTTDACEAFCRKYQRHEAGLTVYGDASGANQRTTGNSDYDLIREYFGRVRFRNVRYEIPTRNPSVRDRIAVVNARLRNAFGEVTLRVHRRCTELIADFEEVTYKPESTEIDKGRDPRRTHLSDALGYLIWQLGRGSGKVGERPRRLL
jgi:hypothetical protein